VDADSASDGAAAAAVVEVKDTPLVRFRAILSDKNQTNGAPIARRGIIAPVGAHKVGLTT